CDASPTLQTKYIGPLGIALPRLGVAPDRIPTLFDATTIVPLLGQQDCPVRVYNCVRRANRCGCLERYLRISIASLLSGNTPSQIESPRIIEPIVVSQTSVNHPLCITIIANCAVVRGQGIWIDNLQHAYRTIFDNRAYISYNSISFNDSVCHEGFGVD